MFRIYRTYELTEGVKSKALAVFKRMGGRHTVVLLHQTAVVEHDLGTSKVILRTGGWDTPSTRHTINRALQQLPGFQGYRLVRWKNKTWLQDPEGEKLGFAPETTIKL